MNSTALLGVGVAVTIVGVAGGLAGVIVMAVAPRARGQWGLVWTDDQGPAGLGVTAAGGGLVLIGIPLIIGGAWEVPVEPEEEETAITIEPLIGPTSVGLRGTF